MFLKQVLSHDSNSTCVCNGVEHLQSVCHAIGKQSSVLLAAKVESPHIASIPPLVEARCGLVVLQPSHDWTVYHHLAKKRAGPKVSRRSVKVPPEAAPYTQKWFHSRPLVYTIFQPAGGVNPWTQEGKMFWFGALLECADAPFHYLFNSLWIPQSREETLSG